MSGKILVLNGMSYATAILGLGDIQYSRKSFLDRPQDFKMVLFTGGADISPHLYGDTSPDGYCYNDPRRDDEEVEIFNIAREHGILMTGICRGMQFLNVMDGGRMMHHIDGHEGKPHRMQIPGISREIFVNTLHHQMAIPGENGIVVGSVNPRISDIYYGAADAEVEWQTPEIEAMLFPQIQALGVQYHPEMMRPETEGFAFFFNMVKAGLERSMEEVVNIYTQGDPQFAYFTIRGSNAHSAV